MISAEQMTALRTLLTGNLDEHRQVIAEMDQGGGWKGYNELITAAFFEAVDRRFGTRYTLPDIVEYVADVRTRFREPNRGIDPNVAERLIRKALGEGTTRASTRRPSFILRVYYSLHSSWTNSSTTTPWTPSSLRHAP